MGMEHKAYAFDWAQFELDLHPLREDARDRRRFLYSMAGAQSGWPTKKRDRD
jgi:hypothetical protein